MAKRVVVDLRFNLEKIHILPEEPIIGTFVVSPQSHRIDIEQIDLHVELVCSHYDLRGGRLVETKYPVFTSKSICIIKANKGQLLGLTPGNHPFKFKFPPILDRGINPSALLKDKIKLWWSIVGVLVFPKGGAKLTSSHEFVYHVGRELSIANAPSCTVVAKQNFFTHKNIQYKCTLHKSVFIPGETISMGMEIKNTSSSLEVVKARVTLNQYWQGRKFAAETIPVLRFELNTPPLFPVNAKSEKEKTIQFNIPQGLAPSVFPAPLVFVTVSYVIEIEFGTDKNDLFTVQVPINIEDNFPSREPLPPPEVAVRETKPPPIAPATPVEASPPVSAHSSANTPYVPPASSPAYPSAATPYPTSGAPVYPFNPPPSFGTVHAAPAAPSWGLPPQFSQAVVHQPPAYHSGTGATPLGSTSYALPFGTVLSQPNMYGYAQPPLAQPTETKETVSSPSLPKGVPPGAQQVFPAPSADTPQAYIPESVQQQIAASVGYPPASYYTAASQVHPPTASFSSNEPQQPAYQPPQFYPAVGLAQFQPVDQLPVMHLDNPPESPSTLYPKLDGFEPYIPPESLAYNSQQEYRIPSFNPESVE